MKFLLLLVATAFAKQQHCIRECLEAEPHPLGEALMEMKLRAWANCTDVYGNEECLPTWPEIKNVETPCVNGMAGEFPCNNIDLMAFIPHNSMTGSTQTRGNDIWGWEDPITGREYALVCQTDGTTFVDITDPVNPAIIGRLPSNNLNHVSWRDSKVYRDHIFIISEGVDHGMQVFDLTRLRGLGQTNPIRIFDVTAQYNEFGSCHNIAINERSGFAYGIGSRTCNGGPHMVDIREPANPTFAGCFSNDGYTHDSECVIYEGPDSRYTGREICFHYNENTLTIVDHTEKGSPRMLSRLPYTGSAYTHQGWLLVDQGYLLLDDELDESRGNTPGGRTRTYIWDVRNLEAPVHIANYHSPVPSIDHNLYIRGKYAYMSNYESGLRITDVTGVPQGTMEEVAFFDVRPQSNNVQFNGAWSSYNYFRSGIVVTNSIERGLFVLRVNLPDML